MKRDVLSQLIRINLERAGRSNRPKRRDKLDRPLSADELREAGYYEEAEVAYRALLDAAPEDADAILGLGLVLFYQGRFEEAIDLLERAVRLRPGWETAQVHLAKAHLVLGIRDEANVSLTAMAEDQTLYLLPRPLRVLAVALPDSRIAGCREVFRRFGARMHVVTDVDATIRALNAKHSHVILIQSSLPDLGAYRLLRDLKADAVTRTLPVVLVSEGSNAEDAGRPMRWSWGVGTSGGYYDLNDGEEGLVSLIYTLMQSPPDDEPPAGSPPLVDHA